MGLRLVSLATLLVDGTVMGVRYFGNPKTAEGQLPFDAGFEAVAVVIGLGSAVRGEAYIRPSNVGFTGCLMLPCVRIMNRV